MNALISPQNEQFIHTPVREGAFANANEALDTAVDLLRRRQQLRADVQVGIDQADRGELIPASEVFARLEEKAQRIEQAAVQP